MALVKWRPWTYRSLPSVFDELWGRPLGHLGWPLAGERISWRPAANVAARKEELLVRMELPGVNKEDVHISLADDVLTIKGEKHQEEVAADERCCLEERVWGSFERSFCLTDEIDTEKIAATYKHGVLEVHLPRTKDSQTRRIEVEVQ